MEEELKCQVCKQLFCNPILLPCYHSICLNCAMARQQLITSNPNVTLETQGFTSNQKHVIVTTATIHHHSYHQSDISISSNTADSELSFSTEDSDKMSIMSETDSGVVCHATSVPPVVTMFGQLGHPVQPSVFFLSCPVCQKVVYFDAGGAQNLPKNRIMQNIVEKYIETRNVGVKCQLCETNATESTIMCEQCEIFYCDNCLENCHPARGPLATHSLVTPQVGKKLLKLKLSQVEYQCPDHLSMSLSLYCADCKVPACIGCLQARKHVDHNVQQIQVINKAQKTNLSQNLQRLSEKAKTGTRSIERLKDQTEKVNENCAKTESLVATQIDQLIDKIQHRKLDLIKIIQREKELKLRSLRSEVSSKTLRLQQTTALIQFCIEALKDTDPAAFLQIGSMLLARVGNLEGSWSSDGDSAKSTDASSLQVSQASKSSSSYPSNTPFKPDFDLTLDDRCLLTAISQLNFVQMKPAKGAEGSILAAPGRASIIRKECCSENNSVTIAWQPPPTSSVEGYALEIDDGAGGPFREVYCGQETICTVDGLHFNSLYNARVKAFNCSGDGEYSQVISLQTAEVAWFTFDPHQTPQEIRLSNQNSTITSESYEPRVVLGSVGFARGVHYWEYTIDKYDACADPSFGIARLDVSRGEMLGKDHKGWGMYIDNQRSWTIHQGIHASRVEGGIETGSTVGVLLDFDKTQLTFYVNEEQQGPVAFTDLRGVFYPAVSINCNVTLTLRTAIEASTELSDSDSGTKC